MEMWTNRWEHLQLSKLAFSQIIDIHDIMKWAVRIVCNFSSLFAVTFVGMIAIPPHKFLTFVTFLSFYIRLCSCMLLLLLRLCVVL